MNTKPMKLRMADILGLENTIMYLLKNGFYNYYSYRNATIPTGGSPTRNLKIEDGRVYGQIRTYSWAKVRDGVEITKIVYHKNGDVTLVTNCGYMRFWKKQK